MTEQPVKLVTGEEDASDDEVEEMDCIIEDVDVAPTHYENIDFTRQEVVKTDVVFGEVKGEYIRSPTLLYADKEQRKEQCSGSSSFIPEPIESWIP